MFTQLAGQPCNSLGRLNPDGSLDNTFNCGVSTLSAVGGLAVQQDGKILVAGEFTTLGGQSRTNLGRLNNTGPATERLTFDASTITWLRGGTAPEAYGATFDYSTNGVDWTALGAGTRIAGGWQLSGLFLPNRAAVRARGWVTGGYYNASCWFVETRAVTPPKLAALGVGTNCFRFTFESVAGANLRDRNLRRSRRRAGARASTVSGRRLLRSPAPVTAHRHGGSRIAARS